MFAGVSFLFILCVFFYFMWAGYANVEVVQVFSGFSALVQYPASSIRLLL